MSDLRNKLLDPKLVGGRSLFPSWVGVLFVVFLLATLVKGILK